MKKIAFIGIGFYDYDKIILNELRLLNFEVDYYKETSKKFKNKKKHIKDIISKINNKKYEYIFIIKCESISEFDLIYLKEQNPNTKFILYLWDSIERTNIKKKLKYFDKIYSFDRLDCINYAGQLNFLPLFFRRDYDLEILNEKFVYDIFSLSWFHSDRLKVYNDVIKICNQLKINDFMKIYTGYFQYLKLLKKSINNYKILIYNPINIKKTIQLIKKSFSILDISHPQQTGLTMRTIEAIGAQKKIITTNKDIKNYDFYILQNILIIDRSNIKIPKDFFNTKYIPIESKIREQYRIDNWVKKIFNVEN